MPVGNQFFEGAIVGQLCCPTCNCLWQLYPRLRLASFGPDGTSLMQLKKYLQCVGVATLIGAEGITSEGSYTWGNKVALRLRPRGRDHKGTVGFPYINSKSCNFQYSHPPLGKGRHRIIGIFFSSNSCSAIK